MSISRDLTALDEAISIAPQTVTADVDGDAVDTRGADGIRCVFHAGTVSDGTYTPGIEESDDGVTGWAAPAAAEVNGDNTDIAATGDIRVLRYVGNKRYIRMTLAETGATSGAAISGLVTRGHLHRNVVAA